MTFNSKVRFCDIIAISEEISLEVGWSKFRCPIILLGGSSSSVSEVKLPSRLIISFC